jgi:hypothetical protein
MRESSVSILKNVVFMSFGLDYPLNKELIISHTLSRDSPVKCVLSSNFR